MTSHFVGIAVHFRTRNAAMSAVCYQYTVSCVYEQQNYFKRKHRRSIKTVSQPAFVPATVDVERHQTASSSAAESAHSGAQEPTVTTSAPQCQRLERVASLSACRSDPSLVPCLTSTQPCPRDVKICRLV